ncbi:hypothetical protein PG984_008203 [Apiospora sp. TS-2023a]
MSDHPPCLPSDDVGQSVAERQDLDTATPIDFDTPYLLELLLEPQSSNMPSPMLQGGTQQSAGLPYQAEGSHVRSQLPTTDFIQGNLVDGASMTDLDIFNSRFPSYQPSNGDNMTMEESKYMIMVLLFGCGRFQANKYQGTEWLDHWLITPNEHGSDDIANITSYGMSPSQHYQIDGDIQALDRKIDYLFGVSQDSDTMLFEEVSSQTASQTISTQPTTTEPSPMELPSSGLDLSLPLSTGVEPMSESQSSVVPAPTSSSAIVVTHHDEQRKMLVPIRPKHKVDPARIASGLSFTHRGSNPTAESKQPNLNPSRILPPKRKRMIGSCPTLHCGDLLIAEILTQEFPTPNVKTKRARYADKSQVHKQKCTGGIPCDDCRSLWNKPRQRRTLKWTACFDSDLRELDYFNECKFSC